MMKIDDIEDSLVNNLPGETCYDQIVKETYVDKHPVVDFDKETDRIYKQVPEKKVMQVIDKGNVLHNVQRVNLPDVVVWNPWIEKSGGMGDFEPKDGYLNMVCIEPGHVHDFVELKPGESWKATQIINKKNKDIQLLSI
ncbi:unnamed protein product [Ambrosiozyma monospora]|uniref:Unnamed protein product n=1 Tax=Ambrosiozyma monospora TaxID=43982 RepID=A0A9W6Z2N1_AMBMO|nr:unnamed protein product [Ambrosiozyma monospora]